LIVTRKNQFLLNLLDLRVIVNDSYIYHLKPGDPLLLSISTAQQVTMVFTNGFHITPRLHIPCSAGKINRLLVGCLLEDEMLLAGFLLTALLFIIGAFSGLLLAQLLSFGPVIYALYLFYIRRKTFLQVRFLGQKQ
jgi:hypothetical protein